MFFNALNLCWKSFWLQIWVVIVLAFPSSYQRQDVEFEHCSLVSNELMFFWSKCNNFFTAWYVCMQTFNLGNVMDVIFLEVVNFTFFDVHGFSRPSLV